MVRLIVRRFLLPPHGYSPLCSLTAVATVGAQPLTSGASGAPGCHVHVGVSEGSVMLLLCVVVPRGPATAAGPRGQEDA